MSRGEHQASLASLLETCGAQHSLRYLWYAPFLARTLGTPSPMARLLCQPQQGLLGFNHHHCILCTHTPSLLQDSEPQLTIAGLTFDNQ